MMYLNNIRKFTPGIHERRNNNVITKLLLDRHLNIFIVNRVLLITGLTLLFAPEILRVYFILPFPGSQRNETVSWAYWLHNNISWLRIFSLLLVAIPLITILKSGKRWLKGLILLVLGVYGVTYFYANYHFQADKMFYQPTQKTFVSADNDTTNRNNLVIGIEINGEAKAYPIQIIGYHHQVSDTIGNVPVMITYCTVCRTGRVFSPLVNGKPESFRLVGMDHFNAMFEDSATHSWWQQATGIAIEGPLKGAALNEIASSQLPLNSWLRQYPKSLVMQPDTVFHSRYEDLADYDDGSIQSSLQGRNFLSWKPKSWIIGINHEQSSKAYDWNELVKKKLIQDSIAKLPILLVLESDTTSFHAYQRFVNGTVLNFKTCEGDPNDLLIDHDTQSIWNMDGICISGAYKGVKLVPIQAYNEFWHSWQTFQTRVEKYVE